MQSKNYITTATIFLVLILTLLFYNVTSEYKHQLDITNKELSGISQIIKIHELNITLKALRGLTQIDTKNRKELKKILQIDEDKVYYQLKKLHYKNLLENFNNIINNKNKKSNLEIFNDYTKLLKKLDTIRIDVSDKSFLFFEHNRESYYLMTLFSLKIPEAIECIGQIRGLTSGVLSSNVNISKTSVQIESNIYNFLNKIEEIKYFVSKLSPDKATIFNEKLSIIINNFFELQSEIDSILQLNSDYNSKDFFLKSSYLINKIDKLFLITKNMLNNNLSKRKKELLTKLYLNIAIYIFLILLIFYMFYNYYCKIKKENLNELKKREEQQLKEIIRKDFIQKSSLKNLCYIFLSKITEHFKALNGSLYILDDKNKKLYLGAVYAIDREHVKKTLELHDNIITEVTSTKKIVINDINQDINVGNLIIKSSKLVTIPMIEIDTCIGAVQLLFDKNFNKVDVDFLIEIIDLISSYIVKAQKDETVKNHLEIIDKNVLISKTDLQGTIIDVSEAFCQLTEYSKSELIGNNHRILRHPDTTDDSIKNLWNTIKQGKIWTGEVKNKKKSGEDFWLYTVITPDCDINNNIIGYTAIRTDITAKKYIEQISITDSLTSLYNRRHFDNIFPNQLKIAKRNKSKLAFAIIDIDKFKQYNDIYGHQAGDETLKKVALALKNSLNRADDYSFRLGGEEFGLLYKVKNSENAAQVAEKARLNVENLKIVHTGNTAMPFVTISIGVSVIDPGTELTTEDIYKLTDNALYDAKKSGRNRVKVIELT